MTAIKDQQAVLDEMSEVSYRLDMLLKQQREEVSELVNSLKAHHKRLQMLSEEFEKDLNG